MAVYDRWHRDPRPGDQLTGTFGLIRTTTSPTRAVPTFPAAPTSHAPDRNGDGTALTTPEAASSRPWSALSNHSEAGLTSSSSSSVTMTR
jgi:hypothetical protein